MAVERLPIKGVSGPAFGAEPGTTAPGVTPQSGIINPGITEDPSQFRKGLAVEVASAGKQLGAAQQRLGISAPGIKAQFAERGIKIGGKLAAQKDLDRALQAQGDAIQRLTKQAGFTDQVSSGIAVQGLNDRLNSLRQDLLRRGIEFQKVLERTKVSKAEQAAAARNFGAIAGAVVGGVTGGPGGAAAGASIGGGIA